MCSGINERCCVIGCPETSLPLFCKSSMRDAKFGWSSMRWAAVLSSRLKGHGDAFIRSD